jgi:TonB family protein
MVGVTMIWILAALLLTGLFQQSPTARLEVVPVVNPPTGDFPQVGLATFDVRVNAGGRIANHELLYGRPPFIENSRVSFSEWEFLHGPEKGVHMNATFLYKPKKGLPDSTSVISVPLPDSQTQLTSPFPVRVIAPGYPTEGLSGGAVVMQAGIGADGRVQDVRVLNEVTGLTSAAVNAVRDWQFYIPKGVEAQSRSAVVTIHFQAPRLNARGANTPAAPAQAALVSGNSETAPIGRKGVLEAGGLAGLAFTYDGSQWTLPFGLIRGIEFAEGASQTDLTIRFSGGRDEETVTFRLEDDRALAAASILSARTRQTIQF